MNLRMASLLAFLALGWAAVSGAVDRPAEPGVYYFPNYPRDFLIQEVKGVVKARYLVDASGRVSKIRILGATQPAFARAVTEAIAEWWFYPAEVDGKPTALWMEQRFVFQPSRRSYFSLEPLNPALEHRRPVPWMGMRPVYPEELREDRLKGHADVILTIRVDGRVERTEIESTTHPGFRKPAREAAEAWMFHPVDPYKLYEEEHGKRPSYLSPDYGQVQMRLTLLFHPDAPPGGEKTEFPGQVVEGLRARPKR